jgi:hypothetical protein
VPGGKVFKAGLTGCMPRSLSALVIVSSVVAPVLRIASITGKSPVANWSAAPIWICGSVRDAAYFNFRRW